ncbi:MAG: MBL fold metallo-hydrolase [Burkholderiales bacterium]|jgi:glyoxylase-like metal-dependent hydrolase (beta-lactamase superfamily II)
MNAPRLPPGVRFIERDWLSANGILLDDGHTAALVDTGYVKHRALTLALVRRALGDRPLDLVVNTHLHSDHCGGNATLQQAYGARTLIPEASADAVRHWDERLTYDATAQRCDRFTFEGTLEDGATVRLGGLDWTVIAAPGHDPESVILHCAAERLLISADALWATGFGILFPELEGESGVAEQRAILERIDGLDVALVLPGHGPMFTDVRGALRTARDRLERLAADPANNARYAAKALLKYLLLDRERIPVDELPGLMARVRVTMEANRRYLGMSVEALTDWTVRELVRARAAQVEDGVLVNL